MPQYLPSPHQIKKGILVWQMIQLSTNSLRNSTIKLILKLWATIQTNCYLELDSLLKNCTKTVLQNTKNLKTMKTFWLAGRLQIQVDCPLKKLALIITCIKME